MRLITTVLAVAVLAGCGDRAAVPAATEDNARDTARAKLRKCLREQGIEKPAAAGETELRAALDGPCAVYGEQAFGTTGPAEDAEVEDALTRLRACMRDAGIELGPGLDRTDAKVRAALDTCREQLPEHLRP